MIRAALLGAVLVHPVLFLLAFLNGVVFGGNPSFGGGPARDPVFGWEGGLIGMEALLFVCLLTMGLAPLLFSAVGAGLSVGACLLIRLWVPTPENTRIAWGTAGAVLGALIGTAGATIAMNVVGFNQFDEWTGAISAAVIGAIVAAVLPGMGRWLPQAVGGGLGGAVGGWCAAGFAGDGQPMSESALACGFVGAAAALIVAILVGAVVGQICEMSSPNPLRQR